MKYKEQAHAFHLKTEDVKFVLDERVFKLADIEAGFTNMLVVKGHVGSGKTLLLKTLAHVITQNAGTVSFSKQGSDKEPKGYFVHSQPEFNFVTGIVGDELDFAGIDRAPFTEFLKRNVNELSGGELKKLSVKMAMAAEYDVVLLDEPLDMMDDAQSDMMAEYIAKNALKKPVMIATHDDHFDQYADMVIRIDDGEAALRHSVGPSKPVPHESAGRLILSTDRLSVILEGRVFPEISMKCSSGEIVCLFGLNGTGKTLFTRTIANIGRWDCTGSYEWRLDKPMRGVCLQFPEQMAYQETVEEEISDTAGVDNVESVIRVLGWQDRRRSSPFSLSDGEKRTMYLMSNLLTKKCCIFDEPFASLDQGSINFMVNHFYEARNQGKSILYTANRKIDAQYADRVITISEA